VSGRKGKGPDVDASSEADYTRPLERTLAKEALTPDGIRTLSRPGGDGVAGILREIDETYLPRRLELRAGPRELALVVRGGRLLSVDGAKPAKPGPDGGILGRPIDAEDGEAVAALRRVLAAFATGQDAIGVVAGAADADPSASGVSARALAASWGIDLDAGPPTRPPVLDGFLAALGGSARAWLRLADGAEKGAKGGPGEQETLRKVAAEAGGTAPDAAPSCLVLGGSRRAGTVTVARDGAEVLLVLVTQSTPGQIAAAWREALG